MTAKTRKDKDGVSAPSAGVSAGTLRSSTTKTRRGRKTPMERQYVGIDLHRRRSVIVRRDGHGETLATTRIDNDPLALAAAVADAGECPEVVLEATYGWYWAADVLAEIGANVHLAHPLGNAWHDPVIGHVRPKLLRLWTRLLSLIRSIRCSASGWRSFSNGGVRCMSGCSSARLARPVG